MSTIEINNYEDFQARRSSSEQRHSAATSVKRSNSLEQNSSIVIDDEDAQPIQELKSTTKEKKPIQIPKLHSSRSVSKSMVISTHKSKAPMKFNSSLKTPRKMPAIPSIGRHPVQGVLVRFLRNGDVHHPGVKIAINELEIKSWEAFLNYLNQQPKLLLASGGIKNIYSLNGQEIRSIHKFQNRQSYVVASGMFIRTSYVHVNDTFNDEPETNGNQWRSPPMNGEQIFLLPYSRLNMYESIILNRNLVSKFEQWLHKEVTGTLLHYIGNEIITHLYAVTKHQFTEVKSFSHLFNTLKITDTFIGCTDEEFQHSKRYLVTSRPAEFFANTFWSKKGANGIQRYNLKQAPIDAKLSINWVHGYNGGKEQAKTLYTISETEMLYVIGSVGILYELDAKQQRFYTKHNNPITNANVHRYHSLVASSELTPSKDRSCVTIHIWDHTKLETIAELRKEQFGSDISLLTFSSKPDDNFLLIVSRDKPKILLVVDWKRNEVVFSIAVKSNAILSALFVFNTIEWIACITQQHLLFYHINWNSKPLRIAIQRESEVQNIYTGIGTCDSSGERLVVGDTVGSVHVWRLIDNEPKLIVVKESVLENDVHIIVPIGQEIFLLASCQNQIKLWNARLDTIEQIKLKNTFGSVQSICSIRQGVAIGTKLNYILAVEFESGQTNIIVRGHTSPSIGLCCNQSTDNFFSISSDRYLFKWNNKTKSVEWAIKSPQMISCAALHPERNIIVLGTETSKLLIYDTLSSFYVTTIALKVNTGVKALRFSPDGGDLAIGLQNGSVCIFDVVGNGDFQIRTNESSQNKNSPVTDVIWSVDSSYLLVVYNDNIYNIWSIPSFDLVKGKNIQNIPWYQVIHPVACNILDKPIIESHTSSIVLSPNLVLCCGKDGQLRLFRSYYERTSQTLQIGLGSIQSIIPSTSDNTYLVSISDNSAIVEVKVNIG